MEGHNSKSEAGLCIRLLSSRPLWLVLLCVLAPAVNAAPHVHAVLSSDKEYYRDTAAAIEAIFQRKYPSGTFTITMANNTRGPVADSQLIVAVGSNACDAILKKAPATALVCTFLPHSTYRDLMTRHEAAQPADAQRSAIYFDQPLARYMALIRILVPDVKNLGTAVGPLSRQLLPTIQALADEQHLALHPVELQSDDNPVTALSAVVEKSDVFLVNPDQASLNKAVANWLLRLSIRQQIPVIAYSRNYVNAGALAAVYSSPDNIGHDTGETINRWLADTTQPLEDPRYPKYFTVSSNPRVARSLGIKLPKSELLAVKINQLLGSPDSPPQP